MINVPHINSIKTSMIDTGAGFRSCNPLSRSTILARSQFIYRVRNSNTNCRCRRKHFTVSIVILPGFLPPSHGFRPSVNVGRRAKRKSATRRESCIPIGEARRCLRPRVRDHLAAGVEKETREVTLRNGARLPTALELIAKINIHYCNYFLRRGRAEGATAISESARERGRRKERDGTHNKKERERGGGRERERACL